MRGVVPGRDIVVIGASPSAPQALTTLVRRLPDDRPVVARGTVRSTIRQVLLRDDTPPRSTAVRRRE